MQEKRIIDESCTGFTSKRYIDICYISKDINANQGAFVSKYARYTKRSVKPLLHTPTNTECLTRCRCFLDDDLNFFRHYDLSIYFSTESY